MGKTNSSKQPVVVIVGDGWSALGSAGFLAQAGVQVSWIAGSGARLIAPLPALEAGEGSSAWKALVQRLGIEAGELQSGSYLREFRNRAFREPTWVKAPTPESRREARDEVLWSPETRMSGVFEARFDLSLMEVEERIRAQLAEMPHIQRIEGVPVQAIRTEKPSESGTVLTVILGNGTEIVCDQVIYADRWSTLIQIEGLPKNLGFLRQREPTSVLQAVFTHSVAIKPGVMEGFYAPVHREAGEESQRHVWGYFTSEGTRSIWSLVLSSNEIEDNHEIAKKLRRMKQALDKMFGEGFLPEGQKDFVSTVQSETVRFEEGVLYGKGEIPVEPITVPKLPGIAFLTDGYGPSAAMRQVAALLGEEIRPDIEIRTEAPSVADLTTTEAQASPSVTREDEEPTSKPATEGYLE